MRVCTQSWSVLKIYVVLNVSGSAQRGLYAAKELEYALFIHSLCVLGKVIIYKSGRELFPIKVRKRKGTTLQPSAHKAGLTWCGNT